MIVPPPASIWLAPAITPKAIEVPKISKIVVVDLVLQPFLADLIETVKLIEIDRVSIGHDHAMEYDGHTTLLAEATRPDLARLT